MTIGVTVTKSGVNVKACFVRLWWAVLLVGSLISCASPKPCEHRAAVPQPVRYEYAAFYAEFAGDLMAPIDVDAPRSYAWTTARGTFTADDIEKIWQHLGVEPLVEYSVNYIEIALINHLAKQGWELIHFDISGVSSAKRSLHSVYRYIFRRSANRGGHVEGTEMPSFE